MMRRCIRLMDQPFAMNSLASQSSNSGCEGFSDMLPKSSGEETKPSPKCLSQTRFMATRAVSGLSLLAMDFANSKRPLPSV